MHELKSPSRTPVRAEPSLGTQTKPEMRGVMPCLFNNLSTEQMWHRTAASIRAISGHTLARWHIKQGIKHNASLRQH